MLINKLFKFIQTNIFENVGVFWFRIKPDCKKYVDP